MASKQIRLGQLIAPFGPGSIYTDQRGTPHVLCGIDHWFKRYDATRGMQECESRVEFELFEPRISELLRVDRFCIPPDYREARRGQTPPPNSSLTIPAVRFPRWYRHSRTGEMRRFNLNTARIDRPAGGGRWLAVRFVAACAGGHLCEFPWREWIGCSCTTSSGLKMTDRGGSELTSIRIECQSCPPGSSGKRGKTLAGTTARPEEGEQSAFEKAGITCPGDRPWLGEGANEAGCKHPLVGALINQTNLYFSKTLSAISLPDLLERDEEVTQARAEIEQDSNCGVARTLWNMNSREAAVDMIQSGLERRNISRDRSTVHKALVSLFTPVSVDIPGAARPTVPDSELLSFRRAEFNIIRHKVDDRKRVPNLRVIPVSVPQQLEPWIARVNLVERLRETRVFYGFDRLEPGPDSLAEMPGPAMRQLFRHPPSEQQDRWLPAIEVFGEGIYLELNEQRIVAWQGKNDAWLKKRLNEPFIMRLGGEAKTLPPLGNADLSWASRYLLVHSLAHIFLGQLVFDCGYSTASLRERLYVSADQSAPMAGILIYTAAGDAEGTLGGLVRLGRPDRLGPVFDRALSRASWCSADPICSEHLGGTGSRLANLAACHACVLLPETSCETINQGLDRAMVVGTPDNRHRGFMSELLV